MRQGNVPPEPASLSERRLSDAHETISANRQFVQFRARFRGGSSGAPRRARTPPPHTLTGGRGGIRTPEGSHPGGFQDRCLRPLGHPSTCRLVRRKMVRWASQRFGGKSAEAKSFALKVSERANKRGSRRASADCKRILAPRALAAWT